MIGASEIWGSFESDVVREISDDGGGSVRCLAGRRSRCRLPQLRESPAHVAQFLSLGVRKGKKLIHVLLFD